MENHNQEFSYGGTVLSGFLVLAIIICIIPMLYFINQGLILEVSPGLFMVGNALLVIALILLIKGLFSQQPNQARVMIFFGKYKGTFSQAGFYWVNPFMVRKEVSLRIRNMDVEPIKVNDKVGNPVMIGMVLVWRVKDTYRAVFDVESNGLGSFVAIQSDAALREVAGHFAYDNESAQNADGITLRSGSDKIVALLEEKLNERLAMAGIEVVEARLNYLAYAPEIAAVMLRRQQASAVIAAREQIVEGAVSMVKMALNQLKEEGVVELDEERKAAMVSNLLVVLCSDDPAQPVVNTGTLYN